MSCCNSDATIGAEYKAIAVTHIVTVHSLKDIGGFFHFIVIANISVLGLCTICRLNRSVDRYKRVLATHTVASVGHREETVPMPRAEIAK